MSLSPVRSDLGPAPFQRVIDPVDAQVVLCDATNTPIAANPNGVNHPPSQVLVIPDGAGNVVWKDLTGTTRTLAVPAAVVAPFLLPGTISTLEADTTDTFAFVVSWHPEP